MKKFLMTMLILSGFVGLIVISSCTKFDETTTPKSLTYATIIGEARANLDLSNDTNEYGNPVIQWEKVPAGTMIFARINSEDLDPNMADDQYQDILFETTVESNGMYTIQVYAGASNVNVALFADNFKYDQKINDSTWEEEVFTYQMQNLQVIKNMTKNNELFFIP